MELEQRKDIVHKYLENPGLSQRKIARALNIAPSTVWYVLNRYKDTLSVARAAKICKKTPRMDPTIKKKVLQDIKRNPNLSLRKRAQKLGTTVATIRKVMANEGYKAYHVIKVPNRNEKQAGTVKTRVRHLYEELLLKNSGCILMDDETYLYADTAQIKGDVYYYAKMRLGVADKHKFKCLEKFAEKYLIWQGICSCGMKTDVFVTKGTINADLYLEECLKKRLLPFIRKHRSPLIFWPDLATAHYAKKVQDWYQSEGIQFVPKRLNPPNCPELRPVEHFWAIMKRKLMEGKWTIRSAKEMQKIWDRTCMTITNADVQNLMRGIKSKVRSMIRGETLY